MSRPVTSVSFHPSGTVFASSSLDGSIKIFDIRTHALIQEYAAAHVPAIPNSIAQGVNSVRFGGEAGEFMISTGCDGLVKVWDVKEGHLFYTLHGHKGPSTDAIFGGRGEFFATAGKDGLVMLWKSHFDTERNFAERSEMKKHVVPKQEKKEQVKKEEVVPEPKVEEVKNNVKVVRKEEVKEVAEVREIPTPEKTSPVLQEKQVEDVNEVIKSSITQAISTMQGEYTGMLRKIAQQVDMLVETVGVLEGRLTMQEDQMGQVVDKMSRLIRGE